MCNLENSLKLNFDLKFLKVFTTHYSTNIDKSKLASDHLLEIIMVQFPFQML